MTHSQKVSKLRHYREVCSMQKVKLLTLSKKITRMRSLKQKLGEKIGENAERGDISAIIHNLNLAYETGLLLEKGKLVKFIKNISQNFLRQSPRYDLFTKQLYECIRIIGGPTTSRVLASNIEGPSDNTQSRHKREYQFDYYPEGVAERVFENLAKIYNKIKANKQIDGDLLVETAEDEAVIISKCEWDVKSDQVWGWCGREGENHFCDAAFVHIVGDGDDAYARLVDAYRQNRVAGFARVIMINPIHHGLPPLVILLQAVCNKFDHQMVKNQIIRW